MYQKSIIIMETLPLQPNVKCTFFFLLQISIIHLHITGKQGAQDREIEMIPTLWNAHFV